MWWMMIIAEAIVEARYRPESFGKSTCISQPLYHDPAAELACSTVAHPGAFDEWPIVTLCW